MPYHEEDTVSRLIANLERWTGDVPVRGVGALLDVERIDAREARREWRNCYEFEALGQEAALTSATLKALRPGFAFALRTYHLSILTFEMQARRILRVSKATYHRRLVTAHIDFMERLAEEARASRERTQTYLEMLVSA